MNRAEYFQKQKELTRAAYRAETESIRRIRAVTRELVVPLVKQYMEQGMIMFPKEELARRIDHIIREEGAKPVAAAHKLQEEMERFIAEKLHIEIAQLPKSQQNKRMKQENAPRKPIGSTTRVMGRAWAYGTQGVSSYYRDPQTGKIVWTDIPLEYLFRKRKNLSSLVWSAVEEQEEMIFDVVRGGRAAGRNVKDIAKDLETFIKYKDGGKRVVGRWQGMFPNTEAGRKQAWQREYLAAHGGFQPGTDAAKALLRESDAKRWVGGKMTETTKRGTPRLPEAVKQYSSRLGSAGLDYRAIRIARTETTAMLADEQMEIARNSAICDGKLDFVMAKGRDHWGCNCEKYAAASPWDLNDPARPEIPVHPNCGCQWRPHLKSDEEVLTAFRKEMKDDIETVKSTEPEEEAAATSILHGTKTDDITEPSQYQSFRTDDLETIVPGHDGNIPALEESLGITRHHPATINQAINQVNPGYSRDDKLADHNCVNTTLAYELQRNGYRVEALPTPNDTPDAYIKNAFSAFDVKEGDIEQASKGRGDLEERLSQFPDGARFIISQKGATPENEVGHDYIAEKINGRIRYVDGQKHLDEASKNLNDVRITNGKYQLFFMRIDNRPFKSTLDFSRIVMITKQILDNSLKNIIEFNKKVTMTKDEALEFLKKDYLKPVTEEDGTIFYAYIGEYYGNSKGGEDFCFTAYYYTLEQPLDLSRAYMLYVDKETGEVSRANSSLREDDLKWIQEHCEKIDYVDETSEPVVKPRTSDPEWFQFVKQE